MYKAASCHEVCMQGHREGLCRSHGTVGVHGSGGGDVGGGGWGGGGVCGGPNKDYKNLLGLF